MHDDLGVKLPKRKKMDWSKAKYGNCGCGAWQAIMEGQCPTCHDADFQSSVESAYIDRIHELIAETDRLKAALQDIADDPPVSNYFQPVKRSVAEILQVAKNALNEN